jgi:hypothetical protein
MSLARLLVIMTSTAMHSKLATSHAQPSIKIIGKEIVRQTIRLLSEICQLRSKTGNATPTTGTLNNVQGLIVKTIEDSKLRQYQEDLVNHGLIVLHMQLMLAMQE